MERVTVLLPCRDGEKTLPATLRSLNRQTIKPFILVADDHSEDATPEIVRSHGATLIQWPRREPKNYARVPFLINMAWTVAPDSDYYMISGDDNIYPPTYIEDVIASMETAGVVIGSGHNHHLPYSRTQAPTGSGRLIQGGFMRQIMPLISAVTWDSWILLEAKKRGLRAKAFPIPKRHMKERRVRYTFGYGSHRTGTPIVFTLMRVVQTMLRTRSILYPLSILVGQVVYTIRGVPKLDYAPYNNHIKRWRIRCTVWSAVNKVLKTFGYIPRSQRK